MAETVSFFIKISDNGTFKKVEVDAESLKDAVGHVTQEVDRLKGAVVNWAQASQSIEMIQQSMGRFKAAVDDLSAAYAVQEVNEQRLANNMRNTMGARSEDIESIKALCAAQQELGVIGDEVQLAGAQELATYLEKKSSLEQLIPVMNDMLAQQYELGASQESAATIATMLGKVMEGQTEALSRYGYKFDEAQKQILQFGTEEERAAVLAEVVESAVGGMNAELAKTGSGQMKQLANTLGDVKEKLGGMVQSVAPLLTIASQLVIVAAEGTKCATTLQAVSAAFNLTSVRAAGLAVHARVTALAERLLGAAGYSAAAGTTALRVAVTALYATLTMGVSVAITAIVELLSGLGRQADDTADKIEGMRDGVDEVSSAYTNAHATLNIYMQKLGELMEQQRKGMDVSKDETEIVGELNGKYGETMGYFSSVSEWYKALTANSETYCRQMVLEAKTRMLANQIAEKEAEAHNLIYDESGNARRYSQDRKKTWKTDSNGRLAYKVEVEGTSELDKATEKLVDIKLETADLQRQMRETVKEAGELDFKVKGAVTEPHAAKNAVAQHQTGQTTQTAGSIKMEDMQWLEWKGLSIESVEEQLSKAREAFESAGDEWGRAAAKKVMDALSDKLSEMRDANPFGDIKIKMPFEQLPVQINDSTKSVMKLKAASSGLSGSFSSASTALGQFGEESKAAAAAAQAFTIAAAIAQLVGQFASVKKGVEIWSWIAGTVAGTATLVTAIAQIKSVTKMANGAVAYGPTYALVGEYAGASSNPEVVAPLSKLRDLIDTDGGESTGNVIKNVRFVLEGRQLVGLMEKEYKIRNRT